MISSLLLIFLWWYLHIVRASMIEAASREAWNERIHHTLTHRMDLHLLSTSITVDVAANTQPKRYKPTTTKSFTSNYNIFTENGKKQSEPWLSITTKLEDSFMQSSLRQRFAQLMMWLLIEWCISQWDSSIFEVITSPSWPLLIDGRHFKTNESISLLWQASWLVPRFKNRSPG